MRKHDVKFREVYEMHVEYQDIDSLNHKHALDMDSQSLTDIVKYKIYLLDDMP